MAPKAMELIIPNRVHEVLTRKRPLTLVIIGELRAGPAIRAEGPFFEVVSVYL